MIVKRADMRDTLAGILSKLTHRPSPFVAPELVDTEDVEPIEAEEKVD